MNVKYQCGICEQIYDHITEARDCELSSETPIYNVGDLVIIKQDFGWFDGNSAWTIRSLNEDAYCVWLIYVVTAITTGREVSSPWKRAAHHVIYHLETLAMTGERGYRQGWNRPSSHWEMYPIKDPPAEVIEQSKSLIGHTTKTLL